MLRYSPVMVIAKKEIKDSLRNRWVIFISMIFLILSLSVTFAGSAVAGHLSLPEIDALMSSLSTVSVFIIPLAAMLVSYDAFVGEDESGTLLLLMSYPISRLQILMGKLLGHSLIMSATSCFAFGLTAVLLLIFGEAYESQVILSQFSQFIFSSILLAVTFILLGYIVSLKSTEKAKAVGSVLFVWFVFVLIYDLILLAILVADLSFMNQYLINGLIALNPTDLYRAINLIGSDVASGSLALLSSSTMGKLGFYCAMLLWILALLAIANRVFQRRTL
ncbi:ABC transporter permease [Shewanella schlegeliana]|uniref:ABC transporter permease subunit n=1 Tax=Shewanella schlegeliana TaxID=190308 RepID=A0ABS1T288_9GAMM|nr:ABC transporter permease subunit [Shewanella schlegeliana]MBL4914888.1 ABC transporter permease subunit [Shewanella schlegeliana]MCL1110421.1 ABC transporter permease [Shewanella schlegeliana]GIU27742.1 ABC copper transporter permease NosY [Shewanella schlegeliana]